LSVGGETIHDEDGMILPIEGPFIPTTERCTRMMRRSVSEIDRSFAEIERSMRGMEIPVRRMERPVAKKGSSTGVMPATRIGADWTGGKEAGAMICPATSRRIAQGWRDRCVSHTQPCGNPPV